MREKSEFEITWTASRAMGTPILPLSPLSLRMGAIPAALRNRIPAQLRRSIPLYLLCITLFIIVLYADVFSLPDSTSSVLGRASSQKVLAASSHTTFPRKIWQTWKVDPYNFDKRDSNTARSWTTKNPGYRYEVLTDFNDMSYVEYHFGPEGLGRPDIVGMYRSINLTIIKADLLRYMIMYAEGGVYADIDVEALKPASRFLPARYKQSEVDMVIGVEIDQPEFRDHPILGPKSMSFCQWTFMCKPHLPVMLRLVENIMAWLSDKASKQGVPVSDLALDFDEVISGTGPSAFTAAVLEEMNKHPHSGGKITWDGFHGMDESRVVSRVLVLDVEAFAAGQGHSDSGNHNARGALVKHHYHASNWPSKHPRFAHPAFGEVERCNWDADCVRKWDEDVAAYKTMSTEQQQKKISERKTEQLRQLDAARKLQEQASQLEQLGLAVKKAEEESRKKREEEEALRMAERHQETVNEGPSPPPLLFGSTPQTNINAGAPEDVTGAGAVGQGFPLGQASPFAVAAAAQQAENGKRVGI